MEMEFLRDEGDTDLLNRWGSRRAQEWPPPVALVLQEMDLSPVGEAPTARSLEWQRPPRPQACAGSTPREAGPSVRSGSPSGSCRNRQRLDS